MAASLSSGVQRNPTHESSVSFLSIACMHGYYNRALYVDYKENRARPLTDDPRVHDDSQPPIDSPISIAPSSQIRSSLRRALASQSPCPVLAQRWSFKYGRSGSRGGLAVLAADLARRLACGNRPGVLAAVHLHRSCRRPALVVGMRRARLLWLERPHAETSLPRPEGKGPDPPGSHGASDNIYAAASFLIYIHPSKPVFFRFF
jgi:hypothetical protein